MVSTTFRARRARTARSTVLAGVAALALTAAVASAAAGCRGRAKTAQQAEEAPARSGRARIIGYSSPGRVPSPEEARGQHVAAASWRTSSPPARAAAAPPSRPAPPSPSAAARPRVAPASHGDARTVRAIWVTRWDYASAADVERIVADCARQGFNTIFFQVRGEGTVYYRSALEPWAFQLTSKTPATLGRDPGWDPLAVAVEAARRHGVALHAYLNLMPGWKGPSAPPAAAGQLWTRHPDWFVVDRAGQRHDPRRHYAFLNPALPAVRGYLARVAAEVATRYRVDGIHLDYVRWPGDVSDSGYDRETLRLFAAATGGKSPSSDPAAWDAWRAAQIERTLEGIRRAVHRVRPGLPLSAAVIADPDAARSKMLQRSWEWDPARTVDWIVPMNYAENAATYSARVAWFADRVAPSRLVMGVWPRAGWTRGQVEARFATSRRAGIPHTAIYSYGEWKKNVRR